MNPGSNPGGPVFDAVSMRFDVGDEVLEIIGRKIFAGSAVSISVKMVLNWLEHGSTFRFLKTAPIGRGLWLFTLRTGMSKLSNSNEAIGTANCFISFEARVLVFIAWDLFN